MVDGLFAALLFGIGAPLSKLLVADVDPILLAGLLYLGAGTLVGLLLAASGSTAPATEREAGLERADLPWLVGAILAGGVLGPILLLFGLQRTPAATASLLLNFEVVATGLIASLVFREHVGRVTWGAIFAVVCGGVLLSVPSLSDWGWAVGALLIVGACLLWGLDNNLTRRISLRDPRRIVLVKGFAAGAFSVTLALVLGRPFPGVVDAVKALGVGALSYGLSIALFVRSLRQLGAARTGAVFGVAPIAGAILSLLIFHDSPRASFYPAFGLMLLATLLLFRDKHAHVHRHVAQVHSHAHNHRDGHHDHAHSEPIPPGALHAHPHDHDARSHAHPHHPDAHHWHGHPDEDES